MRKPLLGLPGRETRRGDMPRGMLGGRWDGEQAHPCRGVLSACHANWPYGQFRNLSGRSTHWPHGQFEIRPAGEINWPRGRFAAGSRRRNRP